MHAPRSPRLGSLAWIAVGLAFFGCGDPPIHESDSGGIDAGPVVTPDAGLDAASIPDAAVAPDAGPTPDANVDGGPPTCDELDCDDGLPCTDDRCAGGACMHVVDHARCGAGSYCDAALGCVGGEACAADEDCPPSPGGCFGPPRCIPDTRTCTYPVIDGDLDGYGPPVCGGTDCHDADPTIHPGAAEACDGVDNDCDGTPDFPLAADVCAEGEVCASGACTCALGAMSCGGVCRLVETDALNCGACGTRCNTGETCTGGECGCEAPRVYCGSGFFGACVSRDTDVNNCGVCGLRCLPGAECVGGTCQCPAGQEACPLGCAPLGTVTNCGSCGDACGPGASCTPTGCSPRFPWLATYESRTSSSISSGFHAIALGPDGSVIHAGDYNNLALYVVGGGSTPVVPAGRVVVSKHGPDGIRQWMHRWWISGTSAATTVKDVAVGSDGSVYVLLQSRGTLTLHDGTALSNPSFSQVLVVALDAAGSYRWHRYSSSLSVTTAESLDVTGSEITILGDSNAAVSFGGTSLAGFDGFIAVLDTDGGTQLSAFRLTAFPSHLARRGSALWVAGVFNTPITLGSSSLTPIGTTTDIYVAEYTTSGTVARAFAVGLASHDYIDSFAVLSGGDVVLSRRGSSSLDGGTLMRLTPEGALVWFEPLTRQLTALAVDGADRIFAVESYVERSLHQYGPDGALLLDIPIGAQSVELAARGSHVAIGGVWDGQLDVGGRRVRSSVSGAAGIWMSKVEAP